MVMAAVAVETAAETPLEWGGAGAGGTVPPPKLPDPLMRHQWGGAVAWRQSNAAYA